MFTTGRIIFTLIFIIVFIIGIVYSYKKEKGTQKIHYKKTYLILIGLLTFMTLLFLVVKMKKFF